VSTELWCCLYAGGAVFIGSEYGRLYRTFDFDHAALVAYSSDHVVYDDFRHIFCMCCSGDGSLVFLGCEALVQIFSLDELATTLGIPSQAALGMMGTLNNLAMPLYTIQTPDSVWSMSALGVDRLVLGMHDAGIMIVQLCLEEQVPVRHVILDVEEDIGTCSAIIVTGCTIQCASNNGRIYFIQADFSSTSWYNISSPVFDDGYYQYGVPRRDIYDVLSRSGLFCQWSVPY
jgi:hypothetical protein